MGTKYSTILVGGDVPNYNDGPPADDGSEIESNRVKFATIETDIGNPLHEGIKSMDAKLVAQTNEGPDAETGTVTLTTADHNKVLECSGTFTLSLPNPSGNQGFQCTVINAGSGTVTVDVDGGANIDGGASVSLTAGASRKVYVNNAETAYYSVAGVLNENANKVVGGTTNNLVKQTADGDLADAGFLVTAYPVANINIAGGTAETSADDADLIPLYDNSATANKVMRRDNLLSGVVGVEPGAWVPLRKKTFSAASTVDFDDGDIDSTYDHYVFILSNVQLSGGVFATVNLRVSSDAGVSWDSGAADYWYGNHGGTVGQGNAAIISTGGEPFEGFLFLHNPLTNQETLFQTQIVGFASGGVSPTHHGFARRNTASQVDAIQFLPSSGNMTGDITICGIRNATSPLT